jgi:PAP2 superfamily
VALLGAAAVPAPDMLATFQFWSLPAGSDQPPEYVSGHSSYSGAAAATLAGFFCADHISFTHATGTAPGGQARTYPSFSAAAAEAGGSRVFGGQHFEFSNQTGLEIGRGVAGEVLATRLLYQTSPTHHGECPL